MGAEEVWLQVRGGMAGVAAAAASGLGVFCQVQLCLALPRAKEQLNALETPGVPFIFPILSVLTPSHLLRLSSGGGGRLVGDGGWCDGSLEKLLLQQVEETAALTDQACWGIACYLLGALTNN